MGRYAATLLLGFCAAAAAGPLEQFQREVQRIDARFEQRLLDEDGETLESYRGRFSMARPDRFLWRYESPYPLELGSDGDTLWHYDADLRQLTLRDASSVLAGTPAELLGGDASQLDRYQQHDDGEADGLRWLRLQPRDPDSDFQTVRIGFADGLPQAMELRDRLGQLTWLRFAALEVNRPQPAEMFVLAVPEGVTVVDERGAD